MDNESNDKSGILLAGTFVNANKAPDESTLTSHLQDFKWNDAGEFLAEAASGVPFAGPAIKRFMEAGLGLGQYSPEERLQALQWKWLLEQIPDIQKKLSLLLEEGIPEDEQPEPADVAAVINAVLQASKTTADSKKRRLLKNALVNAFDLEQYQLGLTIRLIKIIEELEYGDIDLLGRIYKSEVDSSYIRRQKYPYSDWKQEVNKAKLLIDPKEINLYDLFFTHLESLKNFDLVVIPSVESNVDARSERLKYVDSWRLFFDEQADKRFYSIGASEDGSEMQFIRTDDMAFLLPRVTELGERLISFVLDNADEN